MKKTYVKPEVYFEDFQLSANIAVTCAVPTHYAGTTCQPINGMVLFTTDTHCDLTPEANGLCYQQLEEERKLFNS